MAEGMSRSVRIRTRTAFLLRPNKTIVVQDSVNYQIATIDIVIISGVSSMYRRWWLKIPLSLFFQQKIRQYNSCHRCWMNDARFRKLSNATVDVSYYFERRIYVVDGGWDFLSRSFTRNNCAKQRLSSLVNNHSYTTAPSALFTVELYRFTRVDFARLC